MLADRNWYQRIDVILDSIREGLLAIDEEGKINIVNRAAGEIVGIPARELLGRPVEEVIPNTRLHIVLETGVPEINKRQQISDITIMTNRVPVWSHDGNIAGAVAVFRDITEVIQLAEEITNLKETQSMLEEIINATQDAISVVDENGNGILINPAYKQLTGLTEEDVLNKPATVDIAEGESVHMEVLRTRKPVKNILLKVGPRRKEVVVDAAPLIVGGVLKGSVAVIHDVSHIHQLSRELEGAKQLIRRLEAKYKFEDIIGSGREIRKAVEKARQVAETPATVILRGESGTGKELFAHAIHQASGRSGQFVRVNCAAIPASLMESELFGYVEGAFTGASRGGRRGYFEEAHGGTLFLDEVTEITTEVQAKLLRVLQEKEIVRVGGNMPIPIDIRIIASTNAGLEKMIKEGKFRKDLYYRLNVVPIYIPPLRERKEDIPQLVEFMLKKLNREFGRNVTGISEKAMDLLMRHNWPGNVRELENLMGRAMINMDPRETKIQQHHLPFIGYEDYTESSTVISGLNMEYSGESFEELKKQWESKVISAALSYTGGSRTQAAKVLQISVRSLYEKMKKYGIS